MGIVLGKSNDVDLAESSNIIRKEEEYIDYINEHVNNVKIAYNKLFIPLLDSGVDIVTHNFSLYDLKEAIMDLGSNIANHDLTKYLNEEFYAYRKKFFPTDKEKNDETEQQLIEENFQNAWNHHYTMNPHHPQYWVKEYNTHWEVHDGSIVDMDLGYIVEMICDWEAMGMKFGTNTVDWYYNNAEKEKKCMTDWTKAVVEELLDIIF